MSASLIVQSAEPGASPAGPPCEQRISMTCGANFVSRLCATQASFAEHEGPLSLKCAYRGRETYTVEGTRLVVGPGSYLILNEGRRYSSVIRSAEEVESFCLWFRPGFVEGIGAELLTPLAEALDDPSVPRRGQAGFFERVYPNDDLVSPVVQEVHTAFVTRTLTPEWLDEQFHWLAGRLLWAHQVACSEAERLPAARQATRVELYRRLHRARDFMEASLTNELSLAEVAAVACISPYHFLRVFKAAFGETPREYQTRRRLETACGLLAETDLPVSTICYDLGFESLGSFSWLFRRTYGTPPSHYRWQVRGAAGRGQSIEEPTPEIRH